MKKTKLTLLRNVAFALVATVWLGSCDDDDQSSDPPVLTQNAVEFVQDEGQLSTLTEALEQAGLTDVLSDEGTEITIFAPSNSAFAAYLQANPTVTSLSDVPDEELADVLRYHVVPGTRLAADLTSGSLSTLLDGETIEVTEDNGVVLNGSVRVVSADNRVANGVVHIVDAVLRTAAEEEEAVTIAELATATDDLSILVDALQRVPDLLVAASDSTASLTVFAPTNEAFANFLEGDDRFDDLASIPDEVLTSVLQYHILATKKLGADLAATEETLLGETLSIDKTDGVVINGDVMVTTADIEASNGVVHLIDQVLVPPSLAPESTIAQIATDTEALSVLVSALQRTPDLLETAGNPAADITVFAPTNDAFVALLAALEVESLDDIPDYVLRRVLEYHIVATGKLAADLGNTEETLEGASIDIDNTDGVVINGNTNVVADLANIEASNGVVHVIDQVLIPPFIAAALGTALQPLLFDVEGRFTTLLAAVESQEDILNFLIRANVDGTLFAPTNDAFEALVAENDAFGSLDDVLAAENLADILLYHVGAIRRTSQNLGEASGATHSRLANPNTGEPLEIYYSNGDDGLVLIGYSNVIEADITTPNEQFIVHAIDAVLLPPFQSIVGVAVNNPQFSRLVAALTRVEEESADNGDLLPLVSILSKERGTNDPAPMVPAPFTVFAPTDAAFETLYDVLGVSGVDEIPIETLQAVLLYHVISGEPVFSTDLDLLEDGEAETLGGTFTIDVSSLTIADGNEASEDATIVTANILGTNGVVHAIDQVLLPE